MGVVTTYGTRKGLCSRLFVSREYYSGIGVQPGVSFHSSTSSLSRWNSTPRPVRCRWCRLVRQLRLQQSVDVLPSGLCYPHSAVIYTKRAHRKKLRVVGKVLSHDVKSSTILLWNDCHIILADISLCLPTRGSAPWLREPGSTITLFGYLEQTEAELRFPDLLPVQLPREDMEFFPRVSLQAILVFDSPDVDIKLWNATVAEMEASGVLGKM